LPAKQRSLRISPVRCNQARRETAKSASSARAVRKGESGSASRACLAVPASRRATRSQ